MSLPDTMERLGPGHVKCPITGLEYVRIPDPVGQEYRLAWTDAKEYFNDGDQPQFLTGKVTRLWMCTTQFTIEAFDKLSSASTKRGRPLTEKLDNRKKYESPTYWRMPQCPVVNVHCDDVDVITDTLNKSLKVQTSYRLPTEFEWEWAAFGGEDFEYSGCTNWEHVAWCEPNSDRKAHPVKSKKPNGYGLFDMSGNVWEWTSTEQGSGRVYRGGSWGLDPRSARVAYRYGNDPSYRRYDGLGFRLCFTEPSNSNTENS